MTIIKPPPKEPEFLQPFLSHCRRRRYPNKTDVVRPGDTADVLFYITEGSVVVLIEDEDGREVILDYLNKGAFIGEMALFTLVAIPLGFLIGYGLCAYMAFEFDSDLYRIPLVLGINVYAFSALVVLLSSIVSAIMIWRNLADLDMVAVLKSKE